MVLQLIQGGPPVDVPVAKPPPVVPPAAAPPVVGAPGSVGGPSPGERDEPTTTTSSYPNQGSEGGGTSGQPFNEPPATYSPPATVTTDDGTGSAFPDETVDAFDLTAYDDTLRKPQGIGQLWTTMWTTIWTRPPDVHTKIQGLNDGTQDLFKTTPNL